MQLRVCHCVGHLTNPGGVCCMDLPGSSRTLTRPLFSEPIVSGIKKIEYHENGTIKSIEYFDD